MKLSEELQWRGFDSQTTYRNLESIDTQKGKKFYHGYDASVDSLTIGNLAAVMLDRCFIKHGWQPVILAGGATSLIGDPGGKDKERQLQAADAVERNVAAVKRQLEKLFAGKVDFENNLSWFKDMTVMEFLRDVGKHFSMTTLTQRDYIAKRIGGEGAGISYTEFSYTLLQGYDFLYLHQKSGVNLQLAGSDQWGNCLSGVELVRRVTGDEVHTFTMPLIINKATGKKFGKTEGGAVWLDEKKTSVYQFYQFWLNVDDEGVEEYLKIYTELSKKETETIMDNFTKDKSRRLAQKKLAEEVTKIVHGEEALRRAVKITDALFLDKGLDAMTDEEIEEMAKEVPSAHARPGDDLVNKIVEVGLFTSKSDARRVLSDGGVYVNGLKVQPGTLTQLEFSQGHHTNTRFAIVRRGKNNIGVLLHK